MKILVFGAGVVGIAYAWQLSLAGHDVALLVRPGRKQELESKGIPISCLDNRGGLLFLGGRKKHTNAIYHPVLVEDFSPADSYELILVCVRRNQLGDVLPRLAEKAGDATILFLQNNWSGTAEIEHSLAPSRYLLGFPSVAGGRDERGIQCALEAGTRLGEVDGQITTRLRRIAAVMREAGFKPKLSRQIIPWLQTHYAGVAAAVGCLYKAGSFQALVQSSSLVREMFLALRESLEVCRARGINPMSIPENRLDYLPLFLLVPLTKRLFRSEEARLGLEGHAGHAADEMLVVYHEVLAEGERLGVKMPHLRGFQEYVEKGVLTVNASRMREELPQGKHVVTPN
jgi:2-dehydropantoate 2-reductase